MKTTKEKIEKRQVYLTIEMEQVELEEGLKKAYNRLVKKANIPGFRKGKAPRPILEQYLGKAALMEDTAEHMAPEAYEKAVKEQDLKPIARPQIELEKIDPLTYKVIVPLEPVVKLGDYHQVKVTLESVQLKEEDINNAIEQLRHQHTIWEPVERQINSRDLVTLDIESQVGELPFINQKDAEYQVIKDAEYPLKGFAESLIGLKKGETREFKLGFPQDYAQVEFAGKEASFKVNIKETKQEKLPDVDDDFAKLVDPDLKNVEELRKKVTVGMQQAAQEKAQRDFDQKVIDAVVGLSEIEFPPVVIEEEIDLLINDQMRRWQMDEKGLDEYLKTIKRTPEQLREELRPVAERTVRQALVLSEVAKSEKIEVTQDELKSEIEGMTKDMTAERKDKMLELFNLPRSQMNLTNAIASRKTVRKLSELAKSQGESGQSMTEKSTEIANVPVKVEDKIESAEAQ